MAYGKIKADTLVYDNSGSDVEVTLSSLGNKANLNSPTFTGTPVVPGYAPLAGATFTGNVVMSANLTVQGTTTTISSTTIEVADKNLELGKVSTPTDTTADGGGITLKGATDKTINWVDATDAWTSSEHINLGDGKKLLLGTGQDLEIYHDSNNWNYITSPTNRNLSINPVTGEAGIQILANGAVKLFNDASEKLTTTAADVTVTGTVTDTKGDVRKIPNNNQTGAYVPVAADSGKVITISTGGITINTGVMLVGDVITIINNSGSDQTITQGSGFTMYNTADASTGNRTLAGRGMATLWYGAQDWGYISGAGLS
jgi:hypothetical protein